MGPETAAMTTQIDNQYCTAVWYSNSRLHFSSPITESVVVGNQAFPRRSDSQIVPSYKTYILAREEIRPKKLDIGEHSSLDLGASRKKIVAKGVSSQS